MDPSLNGPPRVGTGGMTCTKQDYGYWTTKDKYKIGAVLEELNHNGGRGDFVGANVSTHKYLYQEHGSDYYDHYPPGGYIIYGNSVKIYASSVVRYDKIIENAPDSKASVIGTKQLSFTKSGGYWKSNKFTLKYTKYTLTPSSAQLKKDGNYYYIQIPSSVKSGTIVKLTITGVPYAVKYYCGIYDNKLIQPVAKLYHEDVSISGTVGGTPPPDYDDGDGKIIIEKRDSRTKELIKATPTTFLVYDNKDCRDTIWKYTGDSCSGHYCTSDEVADKKNTACTRVGQCTGTMYSRYSPTTVHPKTVTTDETGTAVITVDRDKDYCIIEIGAPKGYPSVKAIPHNTRGCPSGNYTPYESCNYTYYTPSNVSDYNKYRYLTAGDKVVVYNDGSNCQTMFDGLLSSGDSMDKRIWLYRYIKELTSGYDYNGILDMNIKDGRQACKHYSCSEPTSTSCLSGSYEEKTFNERNISCYNSVYSTGNGIAYCLESFNLQNNLGTSRFPVESGKMPIQYSNEAIAAIGRLSLQCYVYKNNVYWEERENEIVVDEEAYDNISENFQEPDYFNHISGIKFDNQDLLSSMNSRSSYSTFGNNSNWREYLGVANYYLKPVYAEIMTGKTSYKSTEFKNYIKLGYGVVSRFDATNNYSIPYTLYLGSSFPLSKKQYYLSENSSNACNVVPTQKIITTSNKTPDDLKLSFRIIDTSNPFPGKSGNVRKVGTNWRATSVLNNEYFNYNDYTRWLNLSWNGIRANILRNNSNKKVTNDDYGFNSLIEYVMETTNNSYNKNKKDPIYTINLTPSKIKKIREYNKTHEYDDFTLSWNSKKNDYEINATLKTIIGLK